MVKEENLNEFYINTRKTILKLVHYGFSREEAYFMPAGEVLDYIKILSRERQEEMEREAMENAAEKSSSLKDDIKMAGNTLPGNLF